MILAAKQHIRKKEQYLARTASVLTELRGRCSGNGSIVPISHTFPVR